MQQSLFMVAPGPTDAEGQADYGVCRDYFLREWAERGDKTRASVLMSLNPALSPFCSGEMRQLFCSETTVAPENLRDGRIIIINIPALGDADLLGKAAGVIWKYMSQKKLQNFFGKAGGIKSDDSTRPVVLLADEAHYYTTSFDKEFQSTARSARAVTFYLTQSINSFYNAMGSDIAAKTKAHQLLDNLQGVRIVCQTGSHETYEWFCNVLGKELQERAGRNASVHGEGGGGANVSIQRDVVLEVRNLQALAKGGPAFNCCVTGIIQSAGRQFKGGKLWTQVAFPQV